MDVFPCQEVSGVELNASGFELNATTVFYQKSPPVSQAAKIFRGDGTCGTSKRSRAGVKLRGVARILFDIFGAGGFF